MKRCLPISLLFAALFYASAALAESELYLIPSVQNITIDDPEGEVDDTIAVPLLARWRFESGYDQAWFTELGFLNKSEIDASGSNPGVAIEGFQFGGGYQWRFRLSESFKPWASLGVRVTAADYTRRYRVDADGYLIERYGDRSATEFNLTAGFQNTWSLTDSFDLGVWGEYAAPISSDISWFGIGAVIGYKF